jgi:hypothetical protein
VCTLVSFVYGSSACKRLSIRAPPPPYLGLQVLAGLVAYDLLFSPLHWALHAPELRRKFAAAANEAAASAEAVGPAPARGDVACGRGDVAGWVFPALRALSNPLAWALTRPCLSRGVACAFAEPAATPAAAKAEAGVLAAAGAGLRRRLAAGRRLVGHGTHHTMRGSLQVFSTILVQTRWVRAAAAAAAAPVIGRVHRRRHNPPHLFFGAWKEEFTTRA